MTLAPATGGGACWSELLDALDLGAWQPAEATPRPPAARPIRVRLRRSEDDAEAFLKEKADYLNHREFELHVALHRHAAAHGGPLPPLVEPAIRRTGQRFFEIHGWITGRALNPSLHDELELAGSTLAQFHRSAQSFVFSTDPGVHAEPRSRRAKCNFYRPLLARALGSDEHPLLRRLYAELVRVGGGLHEHGARQAVHGDPAASNLLVAGGQGVILDLDDAHHGWIVEDLAWLITLTVGFDCDPRHGTWSARSAWEGERVAAVVQGYRRIAGGACPSAPALGAALVPAVVCAATDLFLDPAFPPPMLETLESEISSTVTLASTAEAAVELSRGDGCHV